MAELCAEAYSSPPDIDAGGVEILARDNGPTTVAVAFRGTTFDGIDILRDLWAIATPEGSLGLCHRGFLLGARQAMSKVLE